MGRRIEKKRPATYADVLAAPSHLVPELIDGTLYLSPRPATLHARAALTLGQDLGGPFDRGRGGPGGWVILMQPELHLLGQTIVPDLAGWRRERMPELPDAARIDLAPDWVCEVRSPSTEALDRKIKMPKYAAAGVSWMWLVDPEAEVLEAFRSNGGEWVAAGVFSEDEKARIQPFDAIELDLAALWRR